MNAVLGDKVLLKLLSCSQMPDGQIIQYEHDGAFLQEQQVRQIFNIFNIEYSFI